MAQVRYDEFSIGLGAYQAVLAVVGIIVLLFLAWRALRAFGQLQKQGAVRRDQLIGLAWPPLAWLGVLVIAAVIFSSLQAYGPRVALPKTQLTVSQEKTGEVTDLSPKQVTDAERIEQQRALERETKSRVNLNEK